MRLSQLKDIRISKGFTQQDIADHLRIQRSSYTNIENGKRQPDNDTLIKLANFFDVTVDYLLGREENEKAPPIYDDEAWEMMEAMHKRPELKVLFSTSRKVKKEDIELIDKMLKRMAGESDD
jgi:transcriptional regulator with XRE-family HTH domain